MPYLEVQNGIQKEEVVVPSLIGKNLKEAKSILEELGLELVINNEGDGLNISENIITNQVPEMGIKVYKGSKIYVDY